MIIKREFVPLGVLCERDSASRCIIEKAFEDSYKDFDPDRKEEQLSELRKLCLYERDMSWALDKIADLVDGLAKLDREQPYDNGYTFEDVNRIEIEDYTDKELTLRLLSEFDGSATLVGFATITPENCK